MRLSTLCGLHRDTEQYNPNDVNYKICLYCFARGFLIILSLKGQRLVNRKKLVSVALDKKMRFLHIDSMGRTQRIR
jgi:hypothetical protein